MKNLQFDFQIIILTAFVSFTIFGLQGHAGFALTDEGFLWYGVQRVMLGEVPIRDFMSYDPGRYYWSAALMTLWGTDGIVALRGAVAVFQAIGLAVGLMLIARTERGRSFPYLLLSAITLVVWMRPYYKAFDTSLSILLVGALAFLVRNPTSRRYFCAGLVVGLSAVFGRNHGVYGVAGSLGVILWLSINRDEAPGLLKAWALWAAGVGAGFLPIPLMAWFVPGYAAAFWDSVLFIFEAKTTNLPLPIPWPWLVEFGGVVSLDEAREALIGLLFVAIILFGVLSIAWVVRSKLRNEQIPPALVAAAFLALPYAHYAYSRASVSHLAHGIFPSLIGCLVVLVALPARLKWPLAIMLCTASLWVMHPLHRGWRCQFDYQCVAIEISGDSVLVHPKKADEVRLLRDLAHEYAPGSQSFLVTPFWPGAYALLERKSPMWSIYALWPRSETFQRAEIERIEEAKPAFVLISDRPLDGRDKLRFRNTHPLVHAYIVENFNKLSDLPDLDIKIYLRRETM